MDEYIFIYNGNYLTVSGDYNNVPDIVENFGETLEDYFNGKYVMLNAEQIAFLDANPAALPVEAFNMTIAAEATEFDKQLVIEAIENYDTSDSVNTFYVNGTPVWFSKETRTSLNNSISIEKEVGKETTVLWINGTPYTMTVEDAKQMLTDLELYAIACYNNTQNNIASVQAMTLKSELKNFDITQGYPEKLNFNL